MAAPQSGVPKYNRRCIDNNELGRLTVHSSRDPGSVYLIMQEGVHAASYLAEHRHGTSFTALALVGPLAGRGGIVGATIRVHKIADGSRVERSRG